jgi:A/G-specific adenine glycosylase
MLQQTQTSRVGEKYLQFINAFPTIEALAAASLKDVLAVWQGMGYNRRAKYLYELASLLHKTRRGTIPDTPEELSHLPGIGRATAASICAFAFNRPVVFIETNIRAVFIHFFFHDRNDVHDADIMPLAEASLDRRTPRRWYSALMDYGAMLKRRHPNPSRQSAHHQKQPRFEGSRRQARGIILKTLLEHPGITAAGLADMLIMPEDTIGSIIDRLVKDGLIRKKGNVLCI